MEKKFISIDEMQEKLAEVGDKMVWQNIERLGKWQNRVAFRQLFFQAGGNLDE
jgi:hypothetical protein